MIERMSDAEITDAFYYIKFSGDKNFLRWPPSCMEFRELPKYLKEKNIPTVHECYVAAIENKWELHPLVKSVATACGVYWLQKQASDRDGRKRFYDLFEVYKERFLNGELA